MQDMINSISLLGLRLRDSMMVRCPLAGGGGRGRWIRERKQVRGQGRPSRVGVPVRESPQASSSKCIRATLSLGGGLDVCGSLGKVAVAHVPTMAECLQYIIIWQRQAPSLACERSLTSLLPSAPESSSWPWRRCCCMPVPLFSSPPLQPPGVAHAGPMTLSTGLTSRVSRRLALLDDTWKRRLLAQYSQQASQTRH